MFHQNLKGDANEKSTGRSEYLSPRLVHYGAVRDLTRTGTGKASESKGTGTGECSPDGSRKPCSERRVKENIVRIGDHPLGIGLYLFEYKVEYREQWGHGRQFGVMIDEVETVMPEAVSVHPDGYKRIYYGMLGISRNVH